MLCLVATEDRVIPARIRALCRSLGGTKTWHEVPRSDHNSISGEPGYWRSNLGFPEGAALGDANLHNPGSRQIPEILAVGKTIALTRTISDAST